MNYKRVFVPNSVVFITFVTFERQEFLLQNIDLLRKAFRLTKEKYNFQIIAISVLKNHVHMLIKPNDIIDYPNIVKDIKCNFSKEFDVLQIPDYTESQSRKNKREKSIWQRRYWEHTIVDEEDLNRHIDYIHYNSMKHYGIAPKLWEYSTFKKFVENGYYDMNWCNFGDKYNIDKLSYE